MVIDRIERLALEIAKYQFSLGLEIDWSKWGLRPYDDGEWMVAEFGVLGFRIWSSSYDLKYLLWRGVEIDKRSRVADCKQLAYVLDVLEQVLHNVKMICENYLKSEAVRRAVYEFEFMEV